MLPCHVLVEQVSIFPTEKRSGKNNITSLSSCFPSFSLLCFGRTDGLSVVVIVRSVLSLILFFYVEAGHDGLKTALALHLLFS